MPQFKTQINAPAQHIPMESLWGPVKIVFGNEKGGSGKSTAALQTAIGLMYRGYRVGTIDLDARQGTMTRYLRNRYIYTSTHATSLPCPMHLPIDRSMDDSVRVQKNNDTAFFTMAMRELHHTCDFIVIDTPGANTYLNRLAHGMADVLVTPVNDSLLDLDVIANVDPVTHTVDGPSLYTRHVHKLFEEKERQLQRKTDWIVMRNRVSLFDSPHKKHIEKVLDILGATQGFRPIGGFSERPIYRDLFMEGLTMHDLPHLGTPLTSAQQAAFNETDALITAINPGQYVQKR